MYLDRDAGHLWAGPLDTGRSWHVISGVHGVSHQYADELAPHKVSIDPQEVMLTRLFSRFFQIWAPVVDSNADMGQQWGSFLRSLPCIIFFLFFRTFILFFQTIACHFYGFLWLFSFLLCFISLWGLLPLCLHALYIWDGFPCMFSMFFTSFLYLIFLLAPTLRKCSLKCGRFVSFSCFFFY